MCDHSETTYKNNCLKIPSKHTKIKNVNCLENQVRKLSLDSDCNRKKNNSKTQFKSLLEFYDSIPEYDDINHLSNREFYKKLDFLREKQRTFYSCFINENKYGENIHNSWYDNYKSLNNCKNSIIKYKEEDGNANAIDRHKDKDKEKPPSRRSVRIESPEVKEEGRRTRTQMSSGDSTTSNRNKSVRKYNKSPLDGSTSFDDLSDSTFTTRSVPCSPRKSHTSVFWKDNQRQDIDENTFKLSIRDEEDKIIDQILINNTTKSNQLSPTGNNELFRANPVPIESRIPLFNKIMYEQEKRRQQVKRKSKEALKARMNLFSFTKREEEIADIAHRLSKSSPDLFMSFEKHKPYQFKAKPVPKNLFSNYAYQKMHEDQYYRSLQKKIRAEEMLKKSSLPPAMAKREKTHPKLHICPKSFREMYENQMKKIPPSCRRDLENELAKLELDFIMSTPSPVNTKTKTKTKKKRKKSAPLTSSKSSRSASALESVNRSNLAAVLRIQNSRKRMEEEICRRLDEAQLKEEMRWREKVLRKRPVWQSLAYSQEEDLNMRLQMRRDEEKLRNEEHRMQMESMFGRVNQQPTLFERQSNVKFAKNRDVLMSQLYKTMEMCGKFPESCTRSSTSNASDRKFIEMKDESIQAQFDDLLNNIDNDNDEIACTKVVDDDDNGGDVV